MQFFGGEHAHVEASGAYVETNMVHVEASVVHASALHSGGICIMDSISHNHWSRAVESSVAAAGSLAFLAWHGVVFLHDAILTTICRGRKARD